MKHQWRKELTLSLVRWKSAMFTCVVADPASSAGAEVFFAHISTIVTNRDCSENESEGVAVSR